MTLKENIADLTMKIEWHTADLTRKIAYLAECVSDMKVSVSDANNRLHGIEMRLLEERGLSNAFIYERIAELQKKMLDGKGSAGEPAGSSKTDGV